VPDPFDPLRDALDLSAGRARRHTPRVDTALTIPAPSMETGEVELMRAIYWNTAELLAGRGVDTLVAHRIALRVSRALLLIAAVGLEQTDAAHALDVTDRTVERDLALVRELGRSALEVSPGLAPVPTPADRITLKDRRGRPGRPRPPLQAAREVA